VRSQRSDGFIWKNGRLVDGEHEPQGLPTSCTRALLGILWADAEFWKILARDAAAQEITDYGKKHHRLILPSLPTNIWRAFAHDPVWRGHLFDTIAGQYWRLLPPEPVFGMKEVMKELSGKRLPEIIDEYLSLASFDLRWLLAARNFSSNSLEAIKFLGQWLAQDAHWCLNNRGKVPESDVRYSVGRPKEIHIIEALVTFVKQAPRDSNGKIARRFWATPFLRGDIKNLHSFAGTLKQHADKISHYLWNRFSPEVRESLSLYNERLYFLDWLDDLLTTELNRIVQSGAIHHGQLFAGVALSKKTERMLKHKQQGQDLIRLNRMLLVDAYPNDLSAKEIGTDTVRVLATKARALAHYRDGVEVTFHERK
jgi:hypothetical protein